MTIIIETPAPPTRERLVLVRERIIVPESRDATPADLERAGWVRGNYGPEAWESACADACRREDEQRARAEKAERELEDAESRATLMLAVIRERDEARRLHSAAEAQVACRNELRAQDRATDEELLAMASDAFQHRAHGGPVLDDLNKLARAVAARVRQERCLVAQAVGMGADVRIKETPRAYGASFDGWTVSISTRGGPGVTFDVTHVPPADVPAALARLLGEVAR